MSTSTDHDSLSGNLSNAMARHTRAAKNGVLAVVMGSVRNHVDYRPTGNWSVVRDVVGNDDITATIDQLVRAARRTRADDDDNRSIKQARDDLVDAIAAHIRWEAESIATKINNEIIAAGDDLAHAGFVQAAEEEVEASKEELSGIMTQVREKLEEQETAVLLMEKRVISAELPKSVARAQDEHANDEAWVSEMANKLYAIDMAQQNADKEHETLRNEMDLENTSDYFKSAMYKDHLDLNKLMASDRANHLGRVQSHYEGCSNDIIARIGTKPEKLVIVSNLMKDSKGVEQANKMEEYVMSKAVEFWAIIPDIFRIYKDIDVNTGLHWSPPKGDDNKYNEAHRYYRQQQSRKLASAIMSAAPNILKATLSVASTFGEGKHKANFKAELDDGLSLYWHMIQRYHPIDRNTGHHLLQDICKLCSTVSGGNVIQNLRAIQTKVHEAQNICVKIPWSLTGIPMINNLSKVPAIAVELIPLKESCVNFADSGAELDLALAAALRAQDLANSASTTEKKAFQASDTSKPKPDKSNKSKTLKSDLKKFKAFAVKHGYEVTSAKAAPTKPGQQDTALAAKSTHPNGKTKPDLCWVKGCSRTIENLKSFPRHRICGTCLVKCKTEQSDLPLEPGGVWTFKSPKIAKQIKAIVGNNAFKAKLRNELRADDEDGEEGSEDDPSDEEKAASGQPANAQSVKRKRSTSQVDQEADAVDQVEAMRKSIQQKKAKKNVTFTK